MQEVGFGAAACPKGMYCLQLTSTLKDNGETPENELDQIHKDQSKMLWSLGFNLHSMSVVNTKGNGDSNIFICNGPQFELDYDLSIDHARYNRRLRVLKRVFKFTVYFKYFRSQFKAMFGDEQFLPRAPEPEEIIIGGGGDDSSEPTKEDDEEKYDQKMNSGSNEAVRNSSESEHNVTREPSTEDCQARATS